MKQKHMAKNEITVNLEDLDRWAESNGVAKEKLDALKEDLNNKQVERERRGFWKRILKVLGVSVLIGGGVAGGVWAAKEAAESMPEAAAEVAKRELGERGEALKQQAEAVEAAAGTLMKKVELLLAAIPDAAANTQTIRAGLGALLSGAAHDMEEWASGNGVLPDQTLHNLNEFLARDPVLAPYWTAVTAAYEDLKKKALDLAQLKGTFDVTEQDKQEAWEDYKRVFWTRIQNDLGLKAQSISTSAPVPEYQE